MSQDVNELSKQPTQDKAEDNAFFPSPYSLSQYTATKTDFDGVEHKGAYKDGKSKVLMIAAERYVLLENGKMFSTGNHPVEMLLPLHHLMEAGFDVDVATLFGYPVKLELWAMPTEDEAVISTYNKLKEKLKQPKKLADVIKNEFDLIQTIYLSSAGGHAAVVGISESEDVQQTFSRALDNDRFIVTLCHGPAALLSAGLNREKSPLKDILFCVFPDSLDEGANIEIGYLPGR
ncbi:DJ-1/PfpI family protein [Staphylococcus aureus]